MDTVEKFGLAVLFLVVSILGYCLFHQEGGTKTYPDSYEVKSKEIVTASLTARKTYNLILHRIGVKKSIFWTTECEETRIIEFPRDTWEEIKLNSKLTQQEIRDLVGRSIMGKTWDFLKKPRTNK